MMVNNVNFLTLTYEELLRYINIEVEKHVGIRRGKRENTNTIHQVDLFMFVFSARLFVQTPATTFISFNS